MGQEELVWEVFIGIPEEVRGVVLLPKLREVASIITLKTLSFHLLFVG